MKMDVIKRVAALPGMSTQELREMWLTICNGDPPPYNKAFLVRRLAYRLQELSYGGLPSTTLERLEHIAASDGDNPNKRVRDEGAVPVPGTRLMREWKGVEHCVTVLEDGFEYQGRRYKSLTAAARAITGAHWNGWVFFYGNKAKRKNR